MTILGIGIDILHIPRIGALLKRRSPERFAYKILSSREYREWKGLSDDFVSMRFLAVRWAVKEAAYKAFFPNVLPRWKELTYHSLKNGIKPSLKYQPFLQQDVGMVGKIQVSVSHDGEYVFASVLVEETGPLST